jgi:hypothetical protein
MEARGTSCDAGVESVEVIGGSNHEDPAVVLHAVDFVQEKRHAGAAKSVNARCRSIG